MRVLRLSGLQTSIFHMRFWSFLSHLPSLLRCSRRVQLMQNSGWLIFLGNWIISLGLARVFSFGPQTFIFHVDVGHVGRTYYRRFDSVLVASNSCRILAGPIPEGIGSLFPRSSAFVLFRAPNLLFMSSLFILVVLTFVLILFSPRSNYSCMSLAGPIPEGIGSCFLELARLFSFRLQAFIFHFGFGHLGRTYCRFCFCLLESFTQ